MVKCPKCASENESDAKFCHDCGAKLSNPYNLDGKSREYGSTTGVSSGSHSAYYYHSANSAGASSNGVKGSEKKNSMSIAKKIVKICFAAFVILFIAYLGAQALGFNMDVYTEDQSATHDYASLDLDDDGALCFEELEIEYSNVSSSDLTSIFERADKNGNGLIKGAEYDKFYYSLNNHFKELEKEKKNKSKSSSSSSSSSSSNYKNPFPLTSSDGYETCPYCGSEAVYESGNYYKCAECGETIYNPDDLNLNYDEGNY